MGFLKRLFGGGAPDDGAGSASADGGREEAMPLTSGPVTDGDPSLHRVVAWIPLSDPSFESSREQQRLFRLEVPEIASGVVEVKAIAREAGHRTKIAVKSTVPAVNAKGACIGPLGQRVRQVMAELNGEKIDIVDHSDDPAEMIGHALSPARVSSVLIVDPVARAARVIVPDYQLSLAIGREGQNARLAARLTGWRIDIRSDTAPPVAEAPGAGSGDRHDPAAD
mgnify:CR=1 FL=1